MRMPNYQMQVFEMDHFCLKNMLRGDYYILQPNNKNRKNAFLFQGFKLTFHKNLSFYMQLE